MVSEPKTRLEVIRAAYERWVNNRPDGAAAQYAAVDVMLELPALLAVAQANVDYARIYGQCPICRVLLSHGASHQEICPMRTLLEREGA